LEDAKLDPKDIDFIDGSATSCPHLDQEEVNGFKKVLELTNKAAADKINITGFGSYTGFTGVSNEGVGAVLGIKAM